MTLNLQMQRAAALDGAGRTREEIANEVGCSPKTVSVWRQDADYQAVVTRVRKTYEADDLSIVPQPAPR